MDSFASSDIACRTGRFVARGYSEIAAARFAKWETEALEPISKLKQLHLSPKDLSSYNIWATSTSVDFETGDVAGRSGRVNNKFFQPAEALGVNACIHETKGWEVQDNPWPPHGPETEQSVARRLLDFAHVHLTQSSVPDEPGLSGYTFWQYLGESDNKFVNQLAHGHINWQLVRTYAQFLPYDERDDSKFDLDPEFPHRIACLSDSAGLHEDTLMVSEVITLLYQALDAAGQSIYEEHCLFPVTLLAGSGKRFRISQCVLDTRCDRVEMRKSEIIDLTQGVKAELGDYLRILGWLLADPEGDTKYSEGETKEESLSCAVPAPVAPQD